MTEHHTDLDTALTVVCPIQVKGAEPYRACCVVDSYPGTHNGSW